MQSLPSRERGLKSVAKSMLDLGATSLPSRERGLKSGVHGINHAINEVAPLAGAWIEIFFLLSLHKQFLVAPLAGAWIEMCWMGVLAKCQTRSLPSRERGLKCPV